MKGGAELDFVFMIVASATFMMFIVIAVWFISQGQLREDIYIETDSQTREYEAEVFLNSFLQKEDIRRGLRSPGELGSASLTRKMSGHASGTGFERWRYEVSKGDRVVMSDSSAGEFPGGSASTSVAHPGGQRLELYVKVGAR